MILWTTPISRKTEHVKTTKLQKGDHQCTVSAGSVIYEDGGSMFFHGIKIHLQVCTVLQPRRK